MAEKGLPSLCKIILIVCICLQILGCGSESTPEVSRTRVGPVASFSTHEINIGRFPFEPNLHTGVRFPLVNKGGEVLEIQGFGRSCGCTKVGAESLHLKPGKSTEVWAEISISDAGEQVVGISVTTNERGGSRHDLAVRWHACLPVTVSPSIVEFGFVEPNREYVKTVETIADPGFDARPLSIIVESPSTEQFLRCELNDGQIEVKLAGPQRTGKYHANVVVSFSDNVHTIRIPVSCEVQCPLSVIPDAIFLGRVDAGVNVKKKLLLRTKDVLPNGETPRLSFGDEKQDIAWVRQEGQSLLGEFVIRVPDESGPFSISFSVSTTLGESHVTCSGIAE